MKDTTIVPAMSIDQALNGQVCPYCSSKNITNLKAHTRICQEAIRNRNLEPQVDKSTKWAVHETFGKVLVLSREDGLVLAEGDHGRMVVPLSALSFGMLSHLINEIEMATANCELAVDEIEKLINILRIKAGGEIKIPTHPELWPGCRVEVQMGDKVRAITIMRKSGSCYLCDVDGIKTQVNISPKDILKIL